MNIWICCIAKNENRTIEDWVKYHLKSGINKVYIYDNNDEHDDSLYEILRTYIENGKVEIDSTFKGKISCQMQSYNHFIQMNNNNEWCDWCGFLDCDEYLTLNTENFHSLSDYFSECPEDVDCIYINWEVYINNGQIYYENKPVTERFKEKYTAKNNTDNTNLHIKSFVKKGSKSQFVMTPHNACYGTVVNSVFEPCDYSPWQPTEYKNIKIRHYVVKSLQEFIERKLSSHCADLYRETPYTLEYFKKYSNNFDRLDDFFYKIRNELKKNSGIKTYITYFDDSQIKEYDLFADDNTVLFKGNDETIEGDNINDLNHFYCELTTMYWVWKNTNDDLLCFKQYRRPFETTLKPNIGEVITYERFQTNVSVEEWFKKYHGKKRNEDIIKCLIKKFGEQSPYVRYWKYCNYMYTNNTMIINRKDFDKMCKFVFSVLFELDKMWKLNFNWDLYLKNAHKFTEDKRTEYQEHFMAYIGERLISAYITTNLKAITIPRLENNGFYKPY